jgi:hypothetical protein
MIAATLVAALVSGCTTQAAKELVATGGSRADGTVSLSFEYAPYEEPQIDQAKGVATASERCAIWGYSAAQPFGGISRQCQYANQYGCMRWTATMTYQCSGKPKT